MLDLCSRAKIIYGNYYHWSPTSTSTSYGFPNWLYPGLLATLFIIMIIFAVFSALLHNASLHLLHDLFIDHYLLHVISFTFLQALLSSFIVISLSLALARALYYYHFPGRTLIIRFCTVNLALPILVGIFGIISIFGQQGWLDHLYTWLNLRYNFFSLWFWWYFVSSYIF